MLRNVLESKDQRSFVAAIGYMAMTVGLIVFLTFINIPESTKNIVIALIGLFAGKLPDALTKLIGSESEEIKELRDEIHVLTRDNESLHKENQVIKSQYNTLKEEFDTFRKELLNKVKL